MDISLCLRDALSIMRIPEAIAVITGVLSVWYARKESILVYPVGLVSVLLYVYICLTVGIYADAVIQLYYAVVSIYGWYYWIKGGKRNQAQDAIQVPVTTLTTTQQILAFVSTLTLGFVLFFLLNRYTDSVVPLWDGMSTAIFFTAMFLMARKYLENWLYWIAGDIICVPLFFSKGLCLSSLQYGIFTMLAIAGWMAWRKKLRAHQYA